MNDGRPTQAAQAAKAFMEHIGSRKDYLDALENQAVLGGWVGARGAGLWDTGASDAVATEALKAVIARIGQWADECDTPPGEGA